jgi:LytS/YehU family sensor histidine kinase
LNKQISWQEQPLLRLGVGIVGMVVYTLSSVYLLIFFFRYVVLFDVGGDMGGMLWSTIIITLVITMFMTSRAFFFNWRQSAVDAERLKRERVKAQYESLKNQVNPHFLFNSLNVLTNLVYEDQERAVRFIKQLSEVYRYVLDTRDKEVVPIQQEMEFVDAYLFLQQIRFGDKLQVERAGLTAAGSVAPLALQLLVENAIKHNEIPEEHPLRIRITRENNHLVVANTLQRKVLLPEPSSRVGLENLKKQYAFLSDKPIEVVEQAGEFIVRVPIIN